MLTPLNCTRNSAVFQCLAGEMGNPVEKVILTASGGPFRTCTIEQLATYACRCIDNELLMLLRSKKKLSREVFLFDSIGQDKEGNEIRLLDVIEQKPYDIAKEMDLSNDIQKLYQYVEECLTPREKKILIMRYGLGGSREMTQNEIGESLNISRSYVSRIEKRAVEKLKKSFGYY